MTLLSQYFYSIINKYDLGRRATPPPDAAAELSILRQAQLISSPSATPRRHDAGFIAGSFPTLYTPKARYSNANSCRNTAPVARYTSLSLRCRRDA